MFHVEIVLAKEVTEDRVDYIEAVSDVDTEKDVFVLYSSLVDEYYPAELVEMHVASMDYDEDEEFESE